MKFTDPIARYLITIVIFAIIFIFTKGFSVVFAIGMALAGSLFNLYLMKLYADFWMQKHPN